MTSPQNLSELLETSEAARNSQWENSFFHALSEGQLELFNPEPQTGPDGWPYLLTKSEHQAKEPFQRILHWLYDKGIGLVINPQKEYPDYVFTYGMLWFFKETGLFYGPSSPNAEGVFEFQVKDIKQAGEPSESYFPSYVRKIIREFLQQQGVIEPRVLMFTLDGIHFELAFSIESLGAPQQEEHQGVLEAISWFLPPHYQMALISEKELPWPFVAL